MLSGKNIAKYTTKILEAATHATNEEQFKISAEGVLGSVGS